jgi:hypothetical protein
MRSSKSPKRKFSWNLPPRTFPYRGPRRILRLQMESIDSPTTSDTAPQRDRNPKHRGRGRGAAKDESEGPKETPEKKEEVKISTPRKYLKGFMQPPSKKAESSPAQKGSQDTSKVINDDSGTSIRTPKTPKPKAPRDTPQTTPGSKKKSSAKKKKNRENQATPQPNTPRQASNQQNSSKKKARFVPHLSVEDAEIAVTVF